MVVMGEDNMVWSWGMIRCWQVKKVELKGI